MVDVLWAILFVTIAIGALVALLGGLYWLSSLLPKKWQESSRSWVFMLLSLIHI